MSADTYNDWKRRNEIMELDKYLRRDLHKKDFTNDWISIQNELPPVGVPVKVLLTNGIETIDYVNEPVDKVVPFQHYLVSKWRPAFEEEIAQYESERLKKGGLTELVQNAEKKVQKQRIENSMQHKTVKNEGFERE